MKKNIVTIGGGTGSFALLSGLKKYPINISAIVSMADDGGSTGVLRDELGVLPPGDVRQCIVALSDSSEMLRKIMNYRFEEGGLKGHNFGNLFLSALEKTTGCFVKGVEEAAKILDVRGEVIPVSGQNMRLHIRLKNKKVLAGENHLDHNSDVREIGIEKVFLKGKVKANPKAVDRIKKADFVVIGPGDHFGSIVPNLLVEGICEALKKTKAKIIYNCNLTNKKGQTENWDLDSYVREISNLIGREIDLVTFNSKKLPEELMRKYEKREGKGAVIAIGNEKKERNYKIIKASLINSNGIRIRNNNSSSRSFIRHDSNKLAKVQMKIIIGK